MVSVSKSTKVLRFATPGRLFASCHFETPAHPQATNATFRWAKRVSTVSTYFPHFEPAICHILSQRFPTFSTYSTVSKLRQLYKCLVSQRQCDPHHLKLRSPRARPWAAGLKSTSVKNCSLQKSASKHRMWQTQRANGRRPPRTRPWPSPMANANVFRIAAPNGIMLPKRRGAKRWGAGLAFGGGELRD